jgi:glycine cleavage system H lipoate-binding protein
MSIILLALFIVLVIGFGAWLQRRGAKVTYGEAIKEKRRPFWNGIFVHPGHAWVEVLEPSLVAVGTDEFTKSVFGTVDELNLPEPGAMIQQGEKVWKMKRGTRQLAQTSPISGRVVEINRELIQNPNSLAQKDSGNRWILKVRPAKLKRELQNLLHGNMLNRWNQSVKEQLVASLSPADFPVLQEGGEIKPGLGDELTPQQWDKVTREFFG